MKLSGKITKSILFIVLLCCVPTLAQTQGQQAQAQGSGGGGAQPTHFSKNGLSFDYPAGMKLEDMSSEGGQHLVLGGGGSAQIMVISRYDKVRTAEQLASARRNVADTFTDTLMTELQKLDPKVTRTPAQTEVAGTQATGYRLRATLNGEPGNAEVYSLQLGNRLVLVTLIGSDKEIAASANAWSTVRSSLKVAESAASARAF